MNWVRTLALGVFLVGGGALLGVVSYRWILDRAKSAEPPPSAQDQKSRPVGALGRIEPAGGVSNLGVVLPDSVQEIAPGIREGAKVKKGTPLIYLASGRDRQLEIDLLTLQIAEAEEKSKELASIGKQRIDLESLRKKQIDQEEPAEVAVQQAKIDLLKKQVDELQTMRDRLAALGAFSVSKQEREQQELALEKAESEWRLAKDALAQFGKAIALKRDLADGQIQAARGEVRKGILEIPLATLKQQKAIAERRLEMSIVRAPIDGEVLKVGVAVGDIVGPPQPLVQMADTTQMAVVVEVYETDVGKIRVGQSASIEARAWPEKKLTGIVQSVGAIIARNRIFDSDPTANVDRRVVEVRIKLDQAEPAARLVNHQVTVSISTE